MHTAVVYARHEHGGHPIHMKMPPASKPSFEVLWPHGPETFTSGRALMRALHGTDSPPHITVEKYFRLDRLPAQPEVTIFDMFSATPDPETKLFLPKPTRLIVPRPRTQHIITVPSFSDALWKPRLGIDLDLRGGEVRKLLFAGFGSRIYRAGYDPEDVLQEVYRGILARNQGTCPWDVKKSSFGHYVHMVCECILNNYHRKLKRINQHEQVGMKVTPQMGGMEDFGMENDVALGAVHESDALIPDPDSAIRIDSARASILLAIHKHGKSGKTLRPEAELALKILPLLEQGLQRTEIAEHLGITSGKAGKALAFLRRTTEAWAIEAGLR